MRRDARKNVRRNVRKTMRRDARKNVRRYARTNVRQNVRRDCCRMLLVSSIVANSCEEGNEADIKSVVITTLT